MVLLHTDRLPIGPDLNKQEEVMGDGDEKGDGEERILSVPLPSSETQSANIFSQLSMPAIEHLARELNVLSEEVVSR